MDPSMTSVREQMSSKGTPRAHSYTTCRGGGGGRERGEGGGLRVCHEGEGLGCATRA